MFTMIYAIYIDSASARLHSLNCDDGLQYSSGNDRLVLAGHFTLSIFRIPQHSFKKSERAAALVEL